ncbi:MAG: hypothetical protein RL368_1256 [Pseudomonadota bacterium]|jgi:hypothetical protein
MSETNLSMLCYASTATEKCSAIEIGLIIDTSHHNNARLQVTGALFFGNNYFLQFLEGSRHNLNLLYNKIVRDERHTNMQVLELREIGSRCFPEWSMKYVRSPSVAAKIYREAGLKEFNPYLLDSFALNAMALAFRNHHEPNEVKHAGVEHPKEISKKTSSFDILKLFGRGT